MLMHYGFPRCCFFFFSSSSLLSTRTHAMNSLTAYILLLLLFLYTVRSINILTLTVSILTLYQSMLEFKRNNEYDL